MDLINFIKENNIKLSWNFTWMQWIESKQKWLVYNEKAYESSKHIIITPDINEALSSLIKEI